MGFLTWFSSLFTGGQMVMTDILMNGLEGAGQTTILEKLDPGKVFTQIIVMGFNVERVQLLRRRIQLTSWGLGYSHNFYPIWRRYYYSNMKGIIFVVDSADDMRMFEVGGLIKQLLSEDLLRNLPLLVYANKQDLNGACSVKELERNLHLDQITDRKWVYLNYLYDLLGVILTDLFTYQHVQSCCGASGEGLQEGLDWLCESLKK